MNISTRLDKAMHDAKIRSQSELARRSGVPQPTINRILKGQGTKGPETSTLVALAQALRVEMKWLQQGIGPQFADEAHATSNPGAPMIAAVEPPARRLLRHWLTDDEAEIVALYRSMTPAGQRLTRIFANRQKLDTASDIADES